MQIQNLPEPVASYCWNEMTSRREDMGMSSRHARKRGRKVKGRSTCQMTFLLIFKLYWIQVPICLGDPRSSLSWRFLFKYQRDLQVAYWTCESGSSVLPAATSQLRLTHGQPRRCDIFCCWLPRRTSPPHGQSGPTAGTQTAQEV